MEKLVYVVCVVMAGIIIGWFIIVVDEWMFN